jgi:hypothetical protein
MENNTNLNHNLTLKELKNLQHDYLLRRRNFGLLPNSPKFDRNLNIFAVFGKKNKIDSLSKKLYIQVYFADYDFLHIKRSILLNRAKFILPYKIFYIICVYKTGFPKPLNENIIDSNKILTIIVIHVNLDVMFEDKSFIKSHLEESDQNSRALRTLWNFRGFTYNELQIKFKLYNFDISGGSTTRRHVINPMTHRLSQFITILEGSNLNGVIQSYFMPRTLYRLKDISEALFGPKIIKGSQSVGNLSTKAVWDRFNKIVENVFNKKIEPNILDSSRKITSLGDTRLTILKSNFNNLNISDTAKNVLSLPINTFNLLYKKSDIGYYLLNFMLNLKKTGVLPKFYENLKYDLWFDNNLLKENPLLISIEELENSIDKEILFNYKKKNLTLEELEIINNIKNLTIKEIDNLTTPLNSKELKLIQNYLIFLIDQKNNLNNKFELTSTENKNLYFGNILNNDKIKDDENTNNTNDNNNYNNNNNNIILIENIKIVITCLLIKQINGKKIKYYGLIYNNITKEIIWYNNFINNKKASANNNNFNNEIIYKIYNYLAKMSVIIKKLFIKEYVSLINNNTHNNDDYDDLDEEYYSDYDSVDNSELLNIFSDLEYILWMNITIINNKIQNFNNNYSFYPLKKYDLTLYDNDEKNNKFIDYFKKIKNFEYKIKTTNLESDFKTYIFNLVLLIIEEKFNIKEKEN